MTTYHFSIKSGIKGTAKDHSRYITRQGKYRKQEVDLIAHGFGNLPEWANDPKELWDAADKYERKNGAAYRELEVALPNQLTHEQKILLVEKLIQKEIGNKPYEYAIHEPIASLGKVPQPHVHLMYSDRVPDGISREAELHFRRFNRLYPQLGGCRKDGCGRDSAELRSQVLEKRALWSTLANESLAEHGYTERVDHRSHSERGLSTKPSRHLGQAKIREQMKNYVENMPDHQANQGGI